MKATIESTDKIVEINSVGVAPPCGIGGQCKTQARVWEGITESGVAFTAYIPIVQVAKDADNSVFERELCEHKKPTPQTLRAIEARFIF